MPQALNIVAYFAPDAANQFVRLPISICLVLEVGSQVTKPRHRNAAVIPNYLSDVSEAFDLKETSFSHECDVTLTSP